MTDIPCSEQKSLACGLRTRQHIAMPAKPNKEDAAAAPEKPSFEDNIKKLEEIVSELEQGNLPLDRSLRLYEEAIGAYRTCHELLEQAEARITTLVETLEGELEEEPFEVAEEDG